MVRLGSGPWSRYLIDFVALSPWSTAAAILGLGALAGGVELRGRDTLELFAIVVVGLVVAFSGYAKNARFLAVLELPLGALAVAFVFDVVARGRVRRAPAVALALVALTCVGDARTLRTFFVDTDLYDPMSVHLLMLRGLVPWPPWDAGVLPSRSGRGAPSPHATPRPWTIARRPRLTP